jgi:hypothetical protein
LNYEIIGIIGTLFILIAFSFTGERKIRIMDTVGAALFVVYGILTQTWSTAILNFFLICINCYKIFKRG